MKLIFSSQNTGNKQAKYMVMRNVIEKCYQGYKIKSAWVITQDWMVSEGLTKEITFLGEFRTRKDPPTLRLRHKNTLSKRKQQYKDPKRGTNLVGLRK